MTTVLFNKNEGGTDTNFYFSIKGHADYAEKGKDIVCAAISTLVYGLALQLEASEGKGEYRIQTFGMQDGDFEVFVRDINDGGKLFAVMQYITDCIIALSVEYPENVFYEEI